MENSNNDSFISWWKFWIEKFQEGLIEMEQVLYVSFVLWNQWWARNEKLFRNINYVGADVAQKIQKAHLE